MARAAVAAVSNESAFIAFMAATIKPGAIRREGRKVDVRKLDKLRWYELTQLDNRENDFLAELELIPLPQDNIAEMLRAAWNSIRSPL